MSGNNASAPARWSRPTWLRRASIPIIVLALGAALANYLLRPPSVAATAETQPVPSTGDAADDCCIWVHPNDPALSTVIGADKDGGIAVYDLSGKELQYLADGRMNNVDLRYNFPLGGASTTLVVATVRRDNAIACYTVDPQTRRLTFVGRVKTAIEVYGACLYVSPRDNAFYCFVTSEDGALEQWELTGNGNGMVAGKKRRSLQVGGKTEGCVADDELGFLYVGEERKALWKYHAEPGIDDEWRQLVCPVRRWQRLSPDLEGLTIYYAGNGSGYLLASSQGSSSFAVFRRAGDNEYLGSFAVKGANGIDGVSGTDGIDVASTALGELFPHGLFVAQDDNNGGANQNFKLVGWERIAAAFAPPLTIDPGRDPRAPIEPAAAPIPPLGN